MTSYPVVKRTFATLRKAEFGFFGVVVYTRVQTPRFCGHACMAGTLFRLPGVSRGLRINWLIVGIRRYAPIQPQPTCSIPEWEAARPRFIVYLCEKPPK